MLLFLLHNRTLMWYYPGGWLVTVPAISGIRQRQHRRAYYEKYKTSLSLKWQLFNGFLYIFRLL